MKHDLTFETHFLSYVSCKIDIIKVAVVIQFLADPTPPNLHPSPSLHFIFSTNAQNIWSSLSEDAFIHTVLDKRIDKTLSLFQNLLSGLPRQHF